MPALECDTILHDMFLLYFFFATETLPYSAVMIDNVLKRQQLEWSLFLIDSLNHLEQK